MYQLRLPSRTCGVDRLEEGLGFLAQRRHVGDRPRERHLLERLQAWCVRGVCPLQHKRYQRRRVLNTTLPTRSFNIKALCAKHTRGSRGSPGPLAPRSSRPALRPLQDTTWVAPINKLKHTSMHTDTTQHLATSRQVTAIQATLPATPAPSHVGCGSVAQGLAPCPELAAGAALLLRTRTPSPSRPRAQTGS